MSEDNFSDIGTLWYLIKNSDWIQDLEKIPYKTIKVLYNIIIPICKNLINNRNPVIGNYLGEENHHYEPGLHFGTRSGLHLIARSGDRMELGF